jgi:hypothetical protein
MTPGLNRGDEHRTKVWAERHLRLESRGAGDLAFPNWLLNMARRTGVRVTAEQRSILEGWVRAHTTPQRLAARSRIVLLAARGLSDRAIAAELGATRRTVRLWKTRFQARGPQALVEDAPGRGRRPTISVSAVREALGRAGRARPPLRQLARELGISATSVHRIAKAHRPEPDPASSRRAATAARKK